MRQEDLDEFLTGKLVPMVSQIPSDGTGTTATRIARNLGGNPHTVARWLQIVYFIHEHVPKFKVRPAGTIMVYYRERGRESKVEIKE